MAEFTFDLDPQRRLLTVVLRGFWTVPVFDAYNAELAVQLGHLNKLSSPRSCLVDARDFAIQTKEVADRMRDGITKRLPLYPERTARVVSCAISRQQAARMIVSAAQRVFEQVEPALGWLLEPAVEAA